MDPTTGGLDQAAITAILERLGLGQFANQATGGNSQLGSQTVGGQPAIFEPGTNKVTNAGSQGGYTDQQLMQGLTPQPSGSSGNGAAWSTSNSVSGAGNTMGNIGQSDPAWFPSNMKGLNAFYQAQTDFSRNQADEIAKLLGGLTQGPTTTTAPINLATQLNNKPDPNVAPVVNSPSGGYLDPAKAIIPGMNFSAPAPGSLPSLTAQPSADALTQTAAKINQQAALPSAPTLTVPQGQGAFPPFRPNMLANGLPSPGPGPLPSAPVATAPAVGGAVSDLGGAIEKGIQMYQQRSAAPDPSVRSYMPSDSQYNVMPSGIAGQSGFITSATPTTGADQIAASGGEGYLPASANTGATVGPSVISNGAGGFSTDPSVASTNVPTDSAAAGAGASAAGIGGAIGSGIQAIVSALTPKLIQNSAAVNIRPDLLPKPIVFSAPQLTGR